MSDSKYNICYYHTSWSVYGRNYHVADLPIDYIPEVAYAFFNIKRNAAGYYVPVHGDPYSDFEKRYTSGGIEPQDAWHPAPPPGAYFGQFGQFKKLKDQGKKFNLGLSIGGWTWSKHFSDAMLNENSRKHFIDATLAICDKYPIFNKINLDWEYISPEGKSYGLGTNVTRSEDGANFVEFLKSLRERLNATGKKHYKISGALVAAPNKMDALPVEQLSKYMDEFHLMTYDYNSSAWGETKAGHHTNLRKADYCPYSVEESVQAYLDLGVPSQKIYIGAAFYSRGFANTDGLAQSSSGTVSDKSWEAGVLDYKDLPVSGATEYWDDKCKAHYSYDPVKRELNSYDTVRSIEEKCKFIKEKNLKGIIVWDSSGDHPYSHDRSLMKALYENLMVEAPAPPPSVPAPPPSVPAPPPSEPAPPPSEPAPPPSEPAPPPSEPAPPPSEPAPPPSEPAPPPSEPSEPELPEAPIKPPGDCKCECHCTPVQSIKLKNIEIELSYTDGKTSNFHL